MANLNEFQKQMELVFASYAGLCDAEQEAAADMTVVMLRQMLRHKNGLRQRLAELNGDADNRQKATSAEKMRNSLVRKMNAASPKAPIKPVQVTTKNELRR